MNGLVNSDGDMCQWFWICYCLQSIELPGVPDLNQQQPGGPQEGAVSQRKQLGVSRMKQTRAFCSPTTNARHGGSWGRGRGRRVPRLENAGAVSTRKWGKAGAWSRRRRVRAGPFLPLLHGRSASLFCASQTALHVLRSIISIQTCRARRYLRRLGESALTVDCGNISTRTYSRRGDSESSGAGSQRVQAPRLEASAPSFPRPLITSAACISRDIFEEVVPRFCTLSLLLFVC